MTDSDNKVIALRSRKPLEETVQAEEKTKEEIKSQFVEAQLELLDQVREQVAAGNLENLILVSRNPHSGLFMQDMIFEPNFHTSGLAFGFSGLLEALKLEVTDIAQLAPTLNASGKILNPHTDDYAEVDDE